MDDWIKFNDPLLPQNENVYIHLNMGDMTDAN